MPIENTMLGTAPMFKTSDLSKLNDNVIRKAEITPDHAHYAALQSNDEVAQRKAFAEMGFNTKNDIKITHTEKGIVAKQQMTAEEAAKENNVSKMAYQSNNALRAMFMSAHNNPKTAFALLATGAIGGGWLIAHEQKQEDLKKQQQAGYIGG